MSEVEVFDGKLIGVVAGMTNDSCQLYERKECLKKATICVFKCNFLLGRIYFFSVSWYILATCWKVRKLSFVLLFSLWVFYFSLAFECFVGNFV